MVNKKQLEEFYKQNLENDIINTISEMKGIDLRKALDIYYSSRLSEQILNDSYGIENMDAKYLAEDLIESKTIFPTDDALFKMLYLAMMDATKKWTGKAWDWGLTLDQLCIYFGDRIQPEDID